MDVVSYISRIAKMDSLSHLDQSVGDFGQSIGYEYYLHLTLNTSTPNQPVIYFLNGFPQNNWHSEFYNHPLNLPKLMNFCENRIVPYVWPAENAQAQQSAMDFLHPNFLNDPINTGICFFTRTPTSLALLVLASKAHTTPENSSLILSSGQIIATYIHQSILDLSRQKPQPHDVVQLTQREKQCLTLVAEGKTSHEVAKQLNVVESTITFHIQNAGKKLGANNRVQAVALAMSGGLISPFRSL